uniref:Uncharacterized protein n=1 Tax=Rhizophora mucronata TaxID=61149 RepID=A0A2P2QE87_RHIMU
MTFTFMVNYVCSNIVLDSPLCVCFFL